MLQLDPGSEEVQQLHGQLKEAVQQLQTALLDLKKQRMIIEVEALQAQAGTGDSTAPDESAQPAAAGKAGAAMTAADTGGPGTRQRGPDGDEQPSFHFHFSDGRQHRQMEGFQDTVEGSRSSSLESSSGDSGSGSSSSTDEGSSSGPDDDADVDGEEGHGGLGLGGSALAHAR